MVDGVDYLSTSVGTRLSAPLFTSIGYYGVFGCSAGSCLLGLLYLVLLVREDRGQEEVTEETPLGETGAPDYGSQETPETPDSPNLGKAWDVYYSSVIVHC